MTESEALTALRPTIERYLKESSLYYLTDPQKDYVLPFPDGVKVFLSPKDWVEGQTLVGVIAPTNIGVQISPELTKFIAVENGKLIFGKLILQPEKGAVFFVHTLLGDFLNRKELEVAVRAVASTANHYDDLIKEQFGGKKIGEM